jgi:hypothetical protein
MRVVVIGKGTIGSAVSKVLEQKGHEVVPVSRNSGEFRADISDSESLKALFSSIGSFDAVAKAAGDVFPGPYERTTDEQRVKSIKSKGMGQINLVRVALPFIADKGSFTLKSAVLTDEYMYGGTIGTTINHLVRFCKSVGGRVATWDPNQLRQPNGLGRIGGLPRVFHRLHPSSGCGSGAGVSARDFDANHRTHSQAAQDGLLVWRPLLHMNYEHRI